MLLLGVATVKTDWHREAMDARAAKDKCRSDHAANKVANALSRSSLAEEIRREWVGRDPALRAKREANAAMWLEQRREQLVHHVKRSEAETMKPMPRLSDVERFPAALVGLWVKFPEKLILRNPTKSCLGEVLEYIPSWSDVLQQ